MSAYSGFSIGFTGTRDGMTILQSATVLHVLGLMKHVGFIGFHHGDCLGADAQAHEIAEALDFFTYVHPPVNPRFRARVETATHYFPEKEYYARNRAIVHQSRFLIAAPKSKARRGGTWWTIDHAKNAGIPVLIVWPDGTLTSEEKP